MSRLRQPGSEAGFTLPELLMSVVILGIIIVPLTAGIFNGLRTSDRTATILASSADRQLLSVYFPPDVHSSSSIDTSAGAWGCTGTAPAGTDSIVQLSWREFDAAGLAPTTTTLTTFVADYRVVQTGVEWQLVRFACTAGGPASQLVVARHLAAKPDVPTVNGGQVSLTLADALGTTYTVSGSRRSP